MMHQGQDVDGHRKQMQRLELRLIMTYAVVILVAIVSISIIALNLSENTLKTKMGAMISTVNAQMTLNLDSYLQKVEKVSSLIFMDPEYYEYDATDDSYDEYEKLQFENEISEQLLRHSMMESFSDFGIVYRDGTTIGSISNGSKKMFGDDIFSILERMITDDVTRDGWSIGYEGSHDRMYYVKELNPNAVLMTAFYTEELGSVFEKSTEISDMTIRLVDSMYHILYTTDATERVGATIPEDIIEMTESQPNSTIINHQYLIALNTCEPGWKVICSVPVNVVLKENMQLRIYVVIIAFVITLFTIFLGKLLSRSITNPVTTMVSDLDQKASFDQLTGLLNKKDFENQVIYYLQEHPDKIFGFLLIDIDDFKKINDTYGHAYGDIALEELGHMLQTVYQKNALIGRLGGDEFAALLIVPDEFAEKSMQYLKQMAKQLYVEDGSLYGERMNEMKMTFSAGLAYYPKHGEDFESLYKKADDAMYRSKEHGKRQVHVYGEEEADIAEKE